MNLIKNKHRITLFYFKNFSFAIILVRHAMEEKKGIACNY